jgi:hypothetical protein
MHMRTVMAQDFSIRWETLVPFQKVLRVWVVKNVIGLLAMNVSKSMVKV